MSAEFDRHRALFEERRRRAHHPADFGLKLANPGQFKPIQAKFGSRMLDPMLDPRLIAGMIAAVAACDDDEIRRMLGLWVSELTPALVYDERMNMLGLTAEEFTADVDAPVIIPVSVAYQFERATIIAVLR
jgi:hypothetical protein